MPDAQFWRGSRVLITGHTGFKGSWLGLWLDTLGAEVIGYSLDIPTTPSLFGLARLDEVVRTTYGDIDNYLLVEQTVREAKPDVVIHMAAQSLVRESYRDPVGTFRTNMLGTAHILEAVRLAGHPAVVLVVTSDKCYETSAPYTARSEGDDLGGRDPYSSSKACAEFVVRTFRDSLLRGRDTPVVVTARAGNVIGGGDWAPERIVPDIVRAVESGMGLEVRNPNAIRPWQHVLDCLSGYIALIERVSVKRDLPSAWNFGPDSEQARSVSWIVDAISQAFDRPLEMLAGQDDGMQEAEQLTLDSTQAREALGWAPAWPIDKSVRLTAEWYQRVWNGEDARVVTLSQLELYSQTA